jgi:hypothetical protein
MDFQSRKRAVCSGSTLGYKAYHGYWGNKGNIAEKAYERCCPSRGVLSSPEPGKPGLGVL